MLAAPGDTLAWGAKGYRCPFALLCVGSSVHLSLVKAMRVGLRYPLVRGYEGCGSARCFWLCLGVSHRKQVPVCFVCQALEAVGSGVPPRSQSILCVCWGSGDSAPARSCWTC